MVSISLVYNLPIKIKSEKIYASKNRNFQLVHYKNIKILSDHQSQEAKMTDDWL